MSEDNTEEVKIETPEGYEPKCLDIVTYPSEDLHVKSVKLEENEFNTDELKHLIYDMFYTMRIKNGVGLSAVQVGTPKQLVVMLLEEPLVMINPVIIAKKGEFKFEEGCLSVPGYFEDRTRAEKIRVAYCDEEGTAKELTAEGLTAFCIQHELDHLDGELFVDNLSALKKMRMRKKVEKTLKQR